MAAGLWWRCFLFCLFCSSLQLTFASEQGKWTTHLEGNDMYYGVYKSLFKGAKITVTVECNSTEEAPVQVGWILRLSPCAEEYLYIDNSIGLENGRLSAYFHRPELAQVSDFAYKFVSFRRHWDPKAPSTTCGTGTPITLTKDLTGNVTTLTMIYKNETETKPPAADTKKESKRDAAETPIETPGPTKTPTEKPDPKKTFTETPAPEKATEKPDPNQKTKPAEKIHSDVITTAWDDGVYLLVLYIHSTAKLDFKVDVNVEMASGQHNYLSAMEWPLLIFYGVMCVLYIMLGLFWLVLLACNWRDLLRVQFWIGGVIVLGMLEKAVFYAEFQSINHTGESVPGAVVFAELVSCTKRTVARMLVIIVSLGFGIVKPRLGPMLHKVLAVGALYFIFAAVEGCLRAVKPKSDQSKNMLLAAIPLALIDAIICWWIFTSLVQTLRTLRLRRNIVKLSLYRHFTNTLVFAVLASIAFMIWSYTQHRLKTCLTDWKELWVDDAYWHLLFSVILIVIMVLWRPNANNQRYAFSPLLDAADDEAEDDVIMNDAFEGMKMRSQRNGSPRQSASYNKAEDDLKWVEENIPASIVDKVLPGVLDSDEELMTEKMEMSKMQ